MLSPDQKFLFQFVAQAAEGQPVTIRIRLFRGLAHSASDKRVSENFRQRAHKLEQAAARQLELPVRENRDPRVHIFTPKPLTK